MADTKTYNYIIQQIEILVKILIYDRNIDSDINYNFTQKIIMRIDKMKTYDDSREVKALDELCNIIHEIKNRPKED